MELVKECHERHPTHGYRWVHAYLKGQEKIDVSPDYVRKCFRYLGIHASTKHRPYSKQKREHATYPNLIFSAWETLDRPRQAIVSDMTAFWTKGHYWELVLYFDAFTKQIIGHCATNKRGWPGAYYLGLEQAIERVKEKSVCMLEEGSGELCVIHTDQGSVYTSKAYNEIIRENGLVRSLSRPGKPTDNPVNESLNGWIKEELLHDFGLYEAQNDEAQNIISSYIDWYNAKRPSYALGYDTPDGFYARFAQGDIARKDTFAHRILDDRPKFVLDKLRAAERDAETSSVGTSDKTLVA